MPKAQETYMDCVGVRKPVMKWLESLPGDSIVKVLYGGKRIKGDDLRIDLQGEIPPTKERPYYQMNCQIQINKGCTILSLTSISREGGFSTEPSIETLIVKAGLQPTRDELLDYWRQVMIPWGTGFKNKGWLTEKGLELADAELVARLNKEGTKIVTNEEDFEKHFTSNTKKLTARDKAKGKGFKKEK